MADEAFALSPIAARAVRHWDDRLVREWEDSHRRVVGRRQGVCRVVSRVLRSSALTRRDQGRNRHRSSRRAASKVSRQRSTEVSSGRAAR